MKIKNLSIMQTNEKQFIIKYGNKTQNKMNNSCSY